MDRQKPSVQIGSPENDMESLSWYDPDTTLNGAAVGVGVGATGVEEPPHPSSVSGTTKAATGLTRMGERLLSAWERLG